MNFLPIHNETLVSPLSSHALIKRLSMSTAPVLKQAISKGESTFQGVLEDDKFRISQQLRQPNNYVPLIEGEIETTRRGCLVFVTYKLFFSSFLFLAFWSVTCLGLCIFLTLGVQNYLYAALAIGLGILNYVITMLNFRKQVAISHALLLDTLNID